MSALAQKLGSWSAPSLPAPPLTDHIKLRQELTRLRSARGLGLGLAVRKQISVLPDLDESRSHKALLRDFAALALIPLQKIWDNPEDDVYDTL